MGSATTGSKMLGLLVGIVLMGAAIYSVAFVDWTKEPPLEPPVVRPLKTMVVGASYSTAGRKYPGKVGANEEVDLAFQVSGQVIELLVKKGQDVNEGDLIARLDPRDFENTLATRQAALDAAKNEYERIKKLDEQGMAAQKETVDSKASFDAAMARIDTAKKNLEDTRLVAPFAGVIADVLVDNFQNLMAKQQVVSLQQVDFVEVVVDVPEERVVRARRGEAKTDYRYVATFEYLPGREYEVEPKEFSTKADPATQTYSATFVMPAPTDALVLPGMTATIREYPRDPSQVEATTFAVPIEAVPVDGQGNYFVWVVTDSEDGTGTVHRTNVDVGEMVQDSILIQSGLTKGDRIALAGVHLLQENQRVKPFSAAENGE